MAEAASPNQDGGTEAGTVVKVACVQDAAAWLKLNYGVAGSRLHGEKAVIETGRKYGIEFDFEG